MNWNSVLFDWNHVRSFLATVEEGSLSAAARALGITQPTLSRQISALEDRLGVTLFERGHRSTDLTAAGLELVDHVRVMFNAANDISLTATGQSQTIEGHVTLTCTGTMASLHLPPILRRLREKAPGIEIELVTSNDVRDLKKREADIAIRHGRPDQPDLIAKLIGETSAHLYAATEYLDKVGRPRSVEDLAKLDFLGFDNPAMSVEMYKLLGVPLTPGHIKMYMSNGNAFSAMMQAGLGIGVLTRNDAAFVTGLEQVMGTLPSVPVPVWLATHRELHSSRRIRLVYDHLSEELRKMLKAG
jgi:DNA-binding transcriptional LysR family regulator